MVVAALAACGTALATSLVATPACGWLARRIGVVDRPGPLKVQQVAIPYLGGLAVLLGLLVSGWTRTLAGEVRPAVVVPLLIAFGLGFGDDWRDLPVGVRVLGELGAGVALAWALPTRFGAAGWPLVVAVELLLVNGVNLLDGLDGLASSIVAGSCAGFALLLGGAGRLSALAALGAIAGFLAYNRPPARIYLGDAGSYLLGTVLAVLLTEAWRPGGNGATSLAACLCVALPAAEVAWAIIRRHRSGLPLLAGDRGHSYDRLAARGWRVGSIALTGGGVQLAFGLLALGVSHAGLVTAAVADACAVVALLGVAAVSGLLSPAPSGP